MSANAQLLTETLVELSDGSPTGEHDQERHDPARLVPLVYDELRDLAQFQIRRGGGFHTRDTTGLVNEDFARAWLRREAVR